MRFGLIISREKLTLGATNIERPTSNVKHRTLKPERAELEMPRGAAWCAVVAAAAIGLFLRCESQASTEGQKGTNATINSSAATNQSSVAIDGQMVLVQAGRFVMGDRDEVDAPQHEVAVSAFYMDKFLVTQQLYEKLMSENPSRWKTGANPVEQVRWSDAVKFCNKRSESEGLQPCYDLKSWTCNFEANGYRLPTEAEWEYACRAGTTTAYFFGDTAAKLRDYAWFDKNSGGHTRPVGQKQPNPWGLEDICGNVWEWCNDFYKVDYYKQSPPQDPKGPDHAETKVVRGGAWRFSAENCRSGYRYNENPGYADVCFGYDIYGFRCVKKVDSIGKQH
jgi:formylglycine-generating enzyme required for sulfatase activity